MVAPLCKRVLYLLLKCVRPASLPQPLFVTGPHVPQQTATSLLSARHLSGQLMPFRSTQCTGREGEVVGRLIDLLKLGLDNSLVQPNFAPLGQEPSLI